MCDDRRSTTHTSGSNSRAMESLVPPASTSSCRRSPSPAKRAIVQLRLETPASSSSNGQLPFSPTHLSPTANDAAAPASFSIFQALALPTPAAAASASPSSASVAPRHTPSPSPSSSSLGIESLHLSDNISRRSSPSPRPSLPAIHTSFPRSPSNRSLLASCAVVADQPAAAAAAPVTPSTTLASASSLLERPSASKQLSGAAWLPAHTAGAAGQMWHHASPLSSSASHTTYLSSAISDPHAHSLHNSPRRPVGTPFAERAFAPSSLGCADDASSVEADSAVEPCAQSSAGWWAHSREAPSYNLHTATLQPGGFAQEQQRHLDERRPPKRRRREARWISPEQLRHRLVDGHEQTSNEVEGGGLGSSSSQSGLTERRRVQDLPANPNSSNGTPPHAKQQQTKPLSLSITHSHSQLTLHHSHHNTLLIIDLRTPQHFTALRLRNSINLAAPADTPPPPAPAPPPDSPPTTTLQWLEARCTTSMSKRRLSHILEAAASAAAARSSSSTAPPAHLITQPPLSAPPLLPSSAATEAYFWDTTDVVLLGSSDDMPDMLSSSSGSGNESEDASRDEGAHGPRTPPPHPPAAHAGHAAKAFASVLDRLRAPVLPDEAELSPSRSGSVYVVRGGFEAVRASSSTAPWLCLGEDGSPLSSPMRTARTHAAYSPLSSSARLRSATDAPRSPWSARREAMRPPTAIDVGAANGPQLPIQLITDAEDLDADMAPPPSASTCFPSTGRGAPPPPLAPPPLHARAGSTGPRRPMLARLDTSEHIKTLAVPPGRRMSSTSPRLRLQTDVSRATPLRSATLDGAEARGVLGTHDARMMSSSPVDVASTASWASASASASETSLSASPKAIEAHLPPPSAVRAPRSAFPFTARSPLEESGAGFSPYARRGSEPPSTGLSPTLGHRSSLLPEPQTPTTRSLSQSSASALESDFTVSEILPGFLYLGPDIATTREAQHLTQALGVRRILNCAAEIEEGGGRHLELHRGGNGVERYMKIELQDHVEAKGVQRHIEDACAFLDDARLHSTPTYVHCKAGKSRSVLVVMAYLIHHLGWPLQRSYAHVVERRRAVSPNIGFVAELMRFEELRLGRRRARGMSGNGEDSEDEELGNGKKRRERDPHARDSLPPSLAALSGADSPCSSETRFTPSPSPSPAPGTSPSAALDAQSSFAREQMGADGRYRARRPPADALLLAPNRRATMAALGSSRSFEQLLAQQQDADADADAEMEDEIRRAL